ncbi:MAG: glycosyltransferase [Clostridiales bacterium]|jgi:glycosyltransferase involved in cell wall biosynthesis|nr:glycosyltransferase [Clostridiales bacterium]
MKLKNKKNVIFILFLMATITLFYKGNFFIKLFERKLKTHETKPKISLIMPIYNVEKYLQESLESAIKQTFEKIEIICVNDGSTDSSLNILKEYEKKDSRIIVKDQLNKGVSNARNVGLNIAKGEYIAFLDPDDYLQSDALKIAYEKAKKNNSDILVFGFTAFPETNEWLEKSGKNRNKNYIENSINAYFENVTPCVWNKLYKKTLLRKNDIKFIEQVNIGEDACFNMMAFPGSKTITFIQDRLYNYRTCRKDSLTWLNEKESMKSTLKIIKEVCEVWERRNILNGNEVKLLQYFINMSYEEITKNTNENCNLAQEFLKTLNPKIYNQIIVEACNKEVKKRIKTIEELSIKFQN